MTTSGARQHGTTRLIYETRDVAARGGIGPERVRTLVARGQLRPAFVTPRGVKLFEPAEVERWATERADAVERVRRQRAAVRAAIPARLPSISANVARRGASSAPAESRSADHQGATRSSPEDPAPVVAAVTRGPRA